MAFSSFRRAKKHDLDHNSSAASGNHPLTNMREGRTTPFTDPYLINGFARAAHFLSHDPDRTTVIYRRFDDVSVRSLLFLEGRVAALERIQRELDDDDFLDHKSNTDITAVSGSWEEFALLGTAMDSCRESAKESANEIPRYARTRWQDERLKRLSIIQNQLPRSVEEASDLKRLRQNLARAEHEHEEDNTDISVACDWETLKLIQDRWAVAKATVDAVKDYRKANSLMKAPQS